MLSLHHNFGPKPILLMIGHREAATQRPARRKLALDARKASRRGPVDVAVVCEEGLACCQLEPLQVTAMKVMEVVEDYIGVRPVAYAERRAM